MTFIVVSTDAAHENFSRQMLPPTPRVARGADRLYFLYQSTGGSDYSFTAPDGEPLVQLHRFDTLAEAEAWVVEDVRQRHALLSAAGGAQ